MPHVTIRDIVPEDYPLLEEFLYLAVYQRDPVQPIPRSVVNEPTVRIYVEAFGRDEHDLGVVAVADGEVIGLAWARVLGGEPRGYGYVDDSTPELAISVVPAFRNQGIGTALLRGLFARLAAASRTRISLSVDRDNPAARLYTRLGFTTIAEQDDDLLMVREICSADLERA